MTRFTSMPIILKRQQSCLAVAPRVVRSILTDPNCLENNILSYEDLQPEWGEDHDDRSSNDTAPFPRRMHRYIHSTVGTKTSQM